MHAQDQRPPNPIEHVKARLEETIKTLREDADRVGEPHLKAMLETSAEVLTGVYETIQDYRPQAEPGRDGAGDAPDGPRPQIPAKLHGDKLARAVELASQDAHPGEAPRSRARIRRMILRSRYGLSSRRRQACQRVSRAS